MISGTRYSKAIYIHNPYSFLCCTIDGTAYMDHYGIQLIIIKLLAKNHFREITQCVMYFLPLC